MREKDKMGSLADPDMRMLRSDELDHVNGGVGGWAISFLPPSPCLPHFLPPSPCLVAFGH